MTSDKVDSGFYPPQMERRDRSESFVYVTMLIHCIKFEKKHETVDFLRGIKSCVLY